MHKLFVYIYTYICIISISFRSLVAFSCSSTDSALRRLRFLAAVWICSVVREGPPGERPSANVANIQCGQGGREGGESEKQLSRGLTIIHGLYRIRMSARRPAGQKRSGKIGGLTPLQRYLQYAFIRDAPPAAFGASRRHHRGGELVAGVGTRG